jgi:hypothetical protein
LMLSRCSSFTNLNYKDYQLDGIGITNTLIQVLTSLFVFWVYQMLYVCFDHLYSEWNKKITLLEDELRLFSRRQPRFLSLDRDLERLLEVDLWCIN